LTVLEGRELLSTLTVNSTADDGSAGTLRWAINQANGSKQAETIVFGPRFDAPQTIRLAGGPLTLTDPATVTISGPGANLLTLSGHKASRVFRIEGGSLALDGVTITGGRANRGGAIRNDGGALWLDHVVIRGNRAQIGGALFNNGRATLTDVVMHGNTARVGSEVFSTRNATLTRRRLSNPTSTVPILNQTFNGTGFPSGWQKFLPGDVEQSPRTFLTITDTTGMNAGIAANASKTVPFRPVGVTTTITAQISSVSSSPQLGNAIFGLLGPNGPGPRSALAVGIDGQGNVFILESSPFQNINQTVVPVGTDPGYTGGPVTMTVIINSTGVQITAGSTTFPQFTFSKDLNNLSMAIAFRNGAYPALGAASQPNQQGGAASFESISISTKGPAPRPRRGGPQTFSDSFNGSGGVPKNWTQILGAAGDITEKPQNVTINDSTGHSAGIASSTFAFNPVGVITTSTAQINSVNADGNAIFGLVGVSASGALTGYLAAGIDAQGNVFIVEQDSNIKQTIVPIGVDQSYKGGSILMKFVIDSTGVEVTAPGFNTGKVFFSKKLNNFSLAAAFSNGAIPALVGASQPTVKGGSATFASISVSTT
jgi:hypothetical protein